MMIMTSNFVFNFSNFCVIICFLTNLLILGISFSTVINAVFAATLLTSGILLCISVILAFQPVFLTRSLVLGILFSVSDLSVSYLVFKTNPLVSILFTSATNLLQAVFLTKSFFTTLLSLLKLTGTGANLSISSLSSSVFRLAKSFLMQNLKYQHVKYF